MASKTEKYMIIAAGITATIVAIYLSYSYVLKKTYQQRYGFMPSSNISKWKPLSYEELSNIKNLVDSSYDTHNPYIRMVRRP